MFFNKRNKELKLAAKALQESTFLLHKTLFNTGEFPIKVSPSEGGNDISWKSTKGTFFYPIVTIDYNYSYGDYEICSPMLAGGIVLLDPRSHSPREVKHWIKLHTKAAIITYDNVKMEVGKSLGRLHWDLLALGYKFVECNSQRLRYVKSDPDCCEPFDYSIVDVYLGASNVIVSYPRITAGKYMFSFKEAREGKVIDFLVSRNVECNNKEEVTSMGQELNGDKLGLLFDAMFSKAKELALDSEVLTICGIWNDSDKESGAPQHSFTIGDRNKTIFDVTLQDTHIMSGTYGHRKKGKITMYYGEVDGVAHTETLLESEYVKQVKYYNDSFLRTMQDVMKSSMEEENG